MSILPFDYKAVIVEYTLNNVGKILDSLRWCRKQTAVNKIIRFMAILLISYGSQKLDVILKYLLKSTSFLFLNIFFRRITLKNALTNPTESIYFTRDNNSSDAIYNIRGPVYEHVDCQSQLFNYYYIPWLTGNLIEKLKSQIKPIIRTYTYNNKEVAQHLIKCFETYPRSVYLELTTLIDTYIKSSDLMSIYKPINIVLNGLPGTGKTTFCDYLGIHYNNQQQCFIHKINMINYDLLPSQTVAKCSVSGQAIINIICLDELDKAFYRYINKINDEQSGDSRESRINDYLSDLLNLIDGNTMTVTNHVIFVFCANDFDLIFKTAPEQYQLPLVSRFIHKTVKPIEKDELVDFIKYYNDKLKTNLSAHDIELKLSPIPATFNITARDLHKLFITNLFNVDDVIKSLLSQ